MKLSVGVLLLLLLAETGDGASTGSAAEVTRARQLLVDRSSSPLALGKATLTVSPLHLENETFRGHYQLKVTPFFFMNEQGSLALAAPAASLRSLAAARPVEFRGTATDAGNGRTKEITGKMSPADNDRGAVTFSVKTDNGPVAFVTSYHFKS